MLNVWQIVVFAIVGMGCGFKLGSCKITGQWGDFAEVLYMFKHKPDNC